MKFHRRVGIIYTKELIEILRDRRTLIAMVVVPIVLYPLLMLGSVQAVTFQVESVDEETAIIGVVGDEQRLLLSKLIRDDRVALERKRQELGPDSEKAKMLPTPLGNTGIIVFAHADEMKDAIRRREIRAGVIFDSSAPVRLEDYDRQVAVEVAADLEEIRSESVQYRVRQLIERTMTRLRRERLERESLPAGFIQPYAVTTVDLSAPPSILGQILPLILILMTITGAIYPAIDLTAGERERGTLESLMVCPVPVIDLIVGKFLVVTTVAIMGATLNLASVSATVYFGGFDKVIASSGGEVPFGKMLVILLCLVPFAVLMSAIMIAVCSYARTFKEAQNYVTPVILAVLIPGGIAALPATKLEGIMLVMPVGNMVLLVRELLLGSAMLFWQVAMVLLSTSLYAGAAVAIAASVFGDESVVFADAGSLKNSLSRRLFKPSERPAISMGFLTVALLFPLWFFVQSIFSPGLDEDAAGLLYAIGWLMPLLFVAVPVAILVYWKVDVSSALAIRMPSLWHLLSGLLLGISAWIPAHELNLLQQAVVGVPQAVSDSAEIMHKTLSALPVVTAFVLIALVPALCEELLFRGFLLSSLGTAARKWTAILVAGAVFGVFHFFIFKFAVAATLGVMLGYLCWQSRSIWPGVIAHFLHNGLGALSVVYPEWYGLVGINDEQEWIHLPAHVLAIGGILFVVGLLLAAKPARK